MGDIMTVDNRKKFLINVLYVGSLLAIGVFAARFMFAYLLPFIIGIGVAFCVQKPAAAISGRFRLKKPVCAVILTVLICAAVLALSVLAVLAAGNRLVTLIGRMPEYLSAFENWLNGIKNLLSANMRSEGGDTGYLDSVFSNAASGFLMRVSDFVTNTATAFIKGIPAFLISSIVTVVASCYIAKDFDRLKKFAGGIVPVKTAEKLSKVKKILLSNTAKFMKGYGIIALITFIELSALFAILGINKPVFKAFIISLVDVLPVLGVGTVMIPWAAIELLKQNYYAGFGLLFGFTAYIIIRNFIEPKIIGGQIGINPLFTLVSMFLGLKLAGIAGMILSPLALTVIVEYYRSDMPT
ncbi:MAG: AI-2E family transporter [Clostridia bacterium]|nr:AI-2E family transporter [Clostridia bacterium]